MSVLRHEIWQPTNADAPFEDSSQSIKPTKPLAVTHRVNEGCPNPQGICSPAKKDVPGKEKNTELCPLSDALVRVI
jgi:hypothetical protein